MLRRRTPLRLKQIIGVLGESGRVNIAEIGIFGVVGCRLPYIVKACPQKLSKGKIRVPIIRNAGFHAARPPAGTGIAQGGTLFILVRQHGLPQRKTIHPPALHHRGRLAAVDNPVGMLQMMLFIVFFPIVISGHLHNVRTVLSALPGHEIGAYGDQRVAFGIVSTHVVHQPAGDLLAMGIRMGVVDFIADGPQKQAGVIAIPADPGVHVTLRPLLEKPTIVIGGFAPLPHVKSL